MTLHMFERTLETPLDVAAQFPDVEINNTQDGVREWATSIVLDGAEAPTIMELPEWAQPIIFDTFEAFAAAIMDPNNTTYDLHTNGHI